MVDGGPVRLVIGVPRKQTPRVRRCRYGEPVRQAMAKIWELSDPMRGKRQAALIRLSLELLYAQPELGISEAVRQRLATVRPATIDRLLASER